MFSGFSIPPGKCPPSAHCRSWVWSQWCSKERVSIFLSVHGCPAQVLWLIAAQELNVRRWFFAFNMCLDNTGVRPDILSLKQAFFKCSHPSGLLLLITVITSPKRAKNLISQKWENSNGSFGQWYVGGTSTSGNLLPKKCCKWASGNKFG